MLLVIIIYILTVIVSYFLERYAHDYRGISPDIGTVFSILIPVLNIVFSFITLYVFVLQDNTKEIAKKFFRL
jgi:uncharacterized BrkB/YihY/UPF0761 family membrane protein